MFYEIFIELRISQIKNFQTIIERHFVNIVEKTQTVISTSYRINDLNWITTIIFIPHFIIFFAYSTNSIGGGREKESK